MKATITILILALIVFACHRKTVASKDIIISNNTDLEKEVDASRSTSLSAGQTVYTNRCGRCHGLKKTENYTAQQWENILKGMIPKAKLNEDEAKQVTAYVMEHAKK